MKTVLFKDVGQGYGFAVRLGNEVHYLMRTAELQNANAVDLQTGALWGLNPDDEVVRINVEMSFEIGGDDDEA